MDQEFLWGVARLALPLFCIALAAVWFMRVGIVNIALDSQIGLGASVYVGAAHFLPLPLAALIAAVVVIFANALLVDAKTRFRLDPLLVGLGLLYCGYGGAQVISHALVGTSGYAQLPAESIGEAIAFAIMVFLSALASICIFVIRPIRVAKVIADAPELAAIQGLSSRLWSHIHSVIGSALVTAAAVYLCEHGGAFTSGIAAGRGFLALAFVAVAGERIWMVLGLSLLFGGLLKFGFQGVWSIELFEALTFLIGTGLVVWSGMVRLKVTR